MSSDSSSRASPSAIFAKAAVQDETLMSHPPAAALTTRDDTPLGYVRVNRVNAEDVHVPTVVAPVDVVSE